MFSQELGHDPLHWMLQMDHNRQVHILPRTHTESAMDVAGAQAKVHRLFQPHVQFSQIKASFAPLYNSSFLATTTRRPSLAPSWTIRTIRTTTLEEDECPPPPKKVLPRNRPGHRRSHDVRRLIDVTNSNLYRQDPFSASNRCVHPR